VDERNEEGGYPVGVETVACDLYVMSIGIRDARFGDRDAWMYLCLCNRI
jgi:hypothetical protein